VWLARDAALELLVHEPPNRQKLVQQLVVITRWVASLAGVLWCYLLRVVGLRGL